MNMIKLHYDKKKRIIYFKNNDETIEIVESEYPSKPVISPNEQRAVYISPLEWECLGSLYLFDLKEAKSVTLIKPTEDNYIPKKVIWINNNIIATIIGFGYGTVAVGGNVYMLNLDTHEKINLTNNGLDVQIIDIQYIDRKLLVKGIKYADLDLNKFEEFVKEIEVNTDF